jgi:hypothetical protein
MKREYIPECADCRNEKSARKKLEAVTDVVLAYRPNSKRKKPRKRKKTKRRS